MDIFAGTAVIAVLFLTGLTLIVWNKVSENLTNCQTYYNTLPTLVAKSVGEPEKANKYRHLSTSLLLNSRERNLKSLPTVHNLQGKTSFFLPTVDGVAIFQKANPFQMRTLTVDGENPLPVVKTVADYIPYAGLTKIVYSQKNNTVTFIQHDGTETVYVKASKNYALKNAVNVAEHALQVSQNPASITEVPDKGSTALSDLLIGFAVAPIKPIQLVNKYVDIVHSQRRNFLKG